MDGTQQTDETAVPGMPVHTRAKPGNGCAFPAARWVASSKLLAHPTVRVVTQARPRVRCSSDTATKPTTTHNTNIHPHTPIQTQMRYDTSMASAHEYYEYYADDDIDKMILCRRRYRQDTGTDRRQNKVVRAMNARTHAKQRIERVRKSTPAPRTSATLRAVSTRLCLHTSKYIVTVTMQKYWYTIH